MDSDTLTEDRRESRTIKNSLQRRLQLGLPTGSQGMVLQLKKQGVHISEPSLPLVFHALNQGMGLGYPVF